MFVDRNPAHGVGDPRADRDRHEGRLRDPVGRDLVRSLYRKSIKRAVAHGFVIVLQRPAERDRVDAHQLGERLDRVGTQHRAPGFFKQRIGRYPRGRAGPIPDRLIEYGMEGMLARKGGQCVREEDTVDALIDDALSRLIDDDAGSRNRVDFRIGPDVVVLPGIGAKHVPVEPVSTRKCSACSHGHLQPRSRAGARTALEHGVKVCADMLLV